MSFAAVTGRAVRWGVMGTGTIAHDFVKVLQALPNCEVAAVGSRSDEGAATEHPRNPRHPPRQRQSARCE